MYRAPPNKPRPVFNDGPLAKVDVFLPKETLRLLKIESEKQKVPVSRLIAQAVDNELDTVSPFNYPCVEPELPFVENAYTEEAGRIFRFLEKGKKPMDRETLMLCRRDIGIEKRSELMLALRELMFTTLVEEYRPRRATFDYAADYRRIRIVETDPRDLKRNRYRTKPESLRGDADE